MADSPFLARDAALRAMPDDERLWVPQAPEVWFRPLLFDTVSGQWVNLLRVRKAGRLNRHLHPAPVYGYVLKGAWRYLEHDWIAREGMFVFEPPGEVHTLVIPEGVDEMVTLFHVCGAMVYVDEAGKTVDVEDVHSKIRKASDHFRKVGLGENAVREFVR